MPKKNSPEALAPDITIVIPCLNEEDTLGVCLAKIEKVKRNENFSLEVIVADNGSKDQSIEIAKSHGVKIISVTQKGYGAALMGGISQAKAPYILMADADDSYDFLEIPKFYRKLKEGYDLVQGCRLPKGGGFIEKNAMPFTHRYFGNPLFTFLVRRWFNSPVNDVYCGLRAFKLDLYKKLKMRCQGMEFATEMIIKSANLGAKTAELPITLHKDGRIQHPPHLRTIRDGWKTLCFFLICAPSKLFLLPGTLMIFLGLTGSALGYFGASWNGISLGAHTMLGSSLFIISGYQAFLIHILSLDISKKLELNTLSSKSKIQDIISRSGFWLSFCLFFAGLMLWVMVFIQWKSYSFGSLDYSKTLKLVIPGASLISISLETLTFCVFKNWLNVELKSKK